jgi:Domain of unknown function (DUF4440)
MRSEASLLEASTRLAQAEREGDLAALEHLLAADYVGYDPSGRTQDRAGVMRAYADGGVRIAQLRQGQLTARVIGELGLVMGVNTLAGAERSYRFDLRIRFLDVYAWRDERWQLIASQATYLP